MDAFSIEEFFSHKLSDCLVAHVGRNLETHNRSQF